MRMSIIPSASARRLLGTAPLTGPTPWLVAIMSFAIVLIAAAGLAISNSASLFTRSVDNRFVIAVPGGETRLNPLLESLRATNGVRSAQAVDQMEMRATLERWLGPAARDRDLPVPSLVTIELDPGVNSAKLETVVAKFGPGLRVESNRAKVLPLIRSLRTLQWVALAMVVMLVMAVTAGVVLAARAALDTHRSTIEVMHGIGATDQQITDLFQRRIAFDALIGSMAGAILAALVLALIATGSAIFGQLSGGAILSSANILALALLPLGLTSVALLVSRAAVLARLKQSL